LLIRSVILVWIVLGEGISFQEIIGMALAAIGAVLLVQLGKKWHADNTD